MQSDIEIRNEAWRLLWKHNWFWKLLGAGILLQVCSQAIVTIVNGIVYRLGVFNITAAMNLMQSRQPLPDLTPRIMWEFASSTFLYFFFAFILGGIAYYGNSVLLLRSTEDKGEGWLKAAFSGFKMPLELAWLSFRIFLVYLFWSLLAAIPCTAILAAVELVAPQPSSVAEAMAYTVAFSLSAAIFIAIVSIPFYRYRHLFRIKADRPEWSAGECMKSCRELTSGNKWRIFKHDCSYWRILLLAMVLLMALVAEILVILGMKASPDAALGIVTQLTNTAGVTVLMISVMHIGVGQTILYRSLRSWSATQADDTLSDGELKMN